MGINPSHSVDKPNHASIQTNQNIQNTGYLKNHKVIRIAGYFPVAGTVAGIARFVDVAQAKNDTLSNRTWQVIRGIAEFLWLGPILAIFDAIFHCVNAHAKEGSATEMDLEKQVSNSTAAPFIKKTPGRLGIAAEQAILNVRNNKFKGVFICEYEPHKSFIMFGQSGDTAFGDFDFKDYEPGSLLLVVLANNPVSEKRLFSSGFAISAMKNQEGSRMYLQNKHFITVLSEKECEYVQTDLKIPDWFKKVLTKPPSTEQGNWIPNPKQP